MTDEIESTWTIIDMQRIYENGNESGTVNMFIGTEVEKTPAEGRRTLFVVGLQDSAQVIGECSYHYCEHVYFGANQSFPFLDTNDSENWTKWENMIEPVLKQDILCTLDIDVRCVEGLLESGLTEYDNFIPMISVKLPYIKLLNYNTTIKFDDKDFRKTNPGVWCWSLNELLDKNKFTDWFAYKKDKIVR